MSDTYQLARIPIVRRSCGIYLRWWYNGWHYWLFYQGAINYKTEGEKYRTHGSRYIKLSSGQVTGNQIEAIRSILNSTQIKIYTDNGWGEFRIEAGEVTVYRNTVDAYSMEITGVVGSRKVSETGSSPIIEIPVAPPPSYCEIVIGNQVWMCLNWDAAYPGSKVYDGVEANRALFGGLYTYAQAMSPGFCPDGWRIPSVADWQELISALGGATEAGKIKQTGTIYWEVPNTGAENYLNFDARGGGYLCMDLGSSDMNKYIKQFKESYFITAGMYDSQRFTAIKLAYDTKAVSLTPMFIGGYYSVRLLKDVEANPNEVVIGNQTWMKYNIDDDISGAKYPGDNPANISTYGRLYSYSMIAAIEALHPGYHVPTLDDFLELVETAGGYLIAGKHLKEVGWEHWNYVNYNEPGDNSTGWTGLPAGWWEDQANELGNVGEWLCRDLVWDELFMEYWIQGMAIYKSSDIAVANTPFSADQSNTYFSVRLIKD